MPYALTEGQKACLRLVAKGMSSKEIAKELNLTPLTVDTYVKAAMARTGATNRRDAARRLQDLEHSQKSGSPPASIAQAASPPDDWSPTQHGGQHGAAGGGEWRDAGEKPGPPQGARPRWSWRVPPFGGRQHDLNVSETLAQIAKVAIVAALAMSAIVTLIEGAMHLLST